MWTQKVYMPKYMNKHFLIAAFPGLILLFGACSSNQSQIQEYDCQLLRTITEYPDSSFFKDPSNLYKEANKFFVLDATRGDVAIWDNTNNPATFHTVGEIGQGPEEIITPKGFYYYKDTLYIADSGMHGLKAFHKGGMVRSIPINWISENRFFIDNGHIYMSDITSDTACYAKIPLGTRDRTALQNTHRYGRLLPICEKEDMNRYRNERILVKGNGCLFTVCPSYPVIERYDLRSNKLLESYDLRNIPIVDKVMNNIENENLPDNTMVLFLPDAYWYKDKLYVICTYSYKGRNKVNTIIALNTSDKLTPYCLYNLPNTYSSIALDNEHIYAAGPNTCSIDTYDIPQ